MSESVGRSDKQLVVSAERVQEWRCKQLFAKLPAEVWALIAGWTELMYGKGCAERLAEAFPNNVSVQAGVSAWWQKRVEGILVARKLPLDGSPFLHPALEKALHVVARKSSLQLTEESYFNVASLDAIERGDVAALKKSWSCDTHWALSLPSLVDGVGRRADGKENIELELQLLEVLFDRVRGAKHFFSGTRRIIIPESLERVEAIPLFKKFGLPPNPIWGHLPLQVGSWDTILELRQAEIFDFNGAFRALLFGQYLGETQLNDAADLFLEQVDETLPGELADVLAVMPLKSAAVLAQKSELADRCRASAVSRIAEKQIYVVATFVKRGWIDSLPAECETLLPRNATVLCGVLRQLVYQEATEQQIAEFIKRYELVCPSTVTESFVQTACYFSDQLYFWMMAHPPERVVEDSKDIKLWEPANTERLFGNVNVSRGRRHELALLPRERLEWRKDWAMWARYGDLVEAEFRSSFPNAFPWAAVAWEAKQFPHTEFIAYCLGVAMGQAATQGDEFAVEYLTWMGADVNASYFVDDRVRSCPLEEAVATGNVRMVELLLSKGAEAGSKRSVKNTPIGLAIRMGRQAVVVAFARYPTADVRWMEAAKYAREQGKEKIANYCERVTDRAKQQPIVARVTQKVPGEVWQQMLKQNRLDFFELCARYPGSLDWAAVAQQAGCEHDKIEKLAQSQLLVAAVLEGDPEKVKQCGFHGDVEKPCYVGQDEQCSPLELAVANGDASLVNAVLARDFSRQARKKNLESRPLGLAVRLGRLDIVKVFEKRAVKDIVVVANYAKKVGQQEIANYCFERALQELLNDRWGGEVSRLDQLIDGGMDVNYLLQAVIDRRKPWFITHLVAKGAKLIPDGVEVTEVKKLPVGLAMRKGDLDAVKALTKDADLLDWTAMAYYAFDLGKHEILHYCAQNAYQRAIKNGDIQELQKLGQRGFQDWTYDFGVRHDGQRLKCTPLGYATLRRKEEVVRYLLRNYSQVVPEGVDPKDIANTPVGYAIRMQNSDLLELFAYEQREGCVNWGDVIKYAESLSKRSGDKADRFAQRCRRMTSVPYIRPGESRSSMSTYYY